MSHQNSIVFQNPKNPSNSPQKDSPFHPTRKINQNSPNFPPKSSKKSTKISQE
jgi:hypothetical protein